MEEELKVVFIGDNGVGKTCLLISSYENKFPEDYVPSFKYYFSYTLYYDSKYYLLGLWDTSGKEEYDKIRPLSYQDSKIILINFDVMNKDSLLNIKEKWIPEIKFYCPNVPYIIVGNKIDLRDDKEFQKKFSKNFVSFKEGKKFANKNGAEGYCECSAKTQKGLKYVYEYIINIYMEKMIKNKKKNIF
jgi:small GTP-binding protein